MDAARQRRHTAQQAGHAALSGSSSKPVPPSLPASVPLIASPAARQRPQLKDEQLKRSLLLAGLLHVWLAVLVGTAPGDARQDEQAGGGRLSVRLQGVGQSGGTPDTQADRGPAGDAPRRRFGGVVRPEDEPAPPDRPGAAREGEWAPQPSTVKQLQDSVSQQGSRPDPITPITQSRSETLRSELPAAPTEVDPRVTRQLDTPRQEPVQVQSAQVAQVEPLARPQDSLQPLPRLTLPAQSAERLDTQVSPVRIQAPQPLQSLQNPLAPRPTELSTLPRLEAPAPRVATLPSPSQASPVTQAIRAQALAALSSAPTTLAASPTLSLPERSTGRLSAETVRPADKVQAPALAPLAAEQGPRAQDLPASPSLAPSEHAVAQLPAEAASSAARISAPSPLSRLAQSTAAQASLQGLKPLGPPAEQSGPGANASNSASAASATHGANTAATPTATEAGTASQAVAGERPLTGNASPGPGARPLPSPGKISLTGADPGLGPAVQAQAGAPDAGAQRGHDVATAPSAPASAPRLNLNLPTSQRGPVASSRSRALLEVAPNPPELKTRLQKEMEKALREDCRKAYAENGLLALGAIALDALRAKGCKF